MEVGASMQARRPTSFNVQNVADPYALRQLLAHRLKREKTLRDASVERALRAIPRELFAAGVTLEAAYENHVIRIKELHGEVISTLSQPAMIVEMLQQLRVRPGDRILEIGTGSGYTSALLAALAGPGGSVTTIDLEADLVAAARVRFEQLGLQRIRAHVGDGAAGAPGGAPFDRMLLTASAADIERTWWDQLSPAGRIVLPLSINGVQKNTAFAAAGGLLHSDSIIDCAFVPMRAPGEGAPATDPERMLKKALSQPARYPVREAFSERDLYRGAMLWCALSDPRFCLLRRPEDDGPLAGLCAGETLVLVQWHHGNAYVVRYGPDEQLAQDLLALILAWVEQDRPGKRALSILAQRSDAPARPVSDASFTLYRPATTFFISLC